MASVLCKGRRLALSDYSSLYTIKLLFYLLGGPEQLIRQDKQVAQHAALVAAFFLLVPARTAMPKGRENATADGSLYWAWSLRLQWLHLMRASIIHLQQPSTLQQPHLLKQRWPALWAVAFAEERVLQQVSISPRLAGHAPGRQRWWEAATFICTASSIIIEQLGSLQLQLSLELLARRIASVYSPAIQRITHY